jgi:hypothetical protein
MDFHGKISVFDNLVRVFLCFVFAISFYQFLDFKFLVLRETNFAYSFILGRPGNPYHGIPGSRLG